MAKYIMALDAGTTSNRCILFNEQGEMCSVAQKEFTQYFPKPGWVEHDADEIWSTQLGVAVEAMAKDRGRPPPTSPPSASPTSGRPPSSGTRNTGEPVCHAIVWQCRRTSAYCDELKEKRTGGGIPAEDRPGHRRLLFRHQAALDSGERARRPGAGGAGRAAVRHRGDLADLEAHRRQGPCDGLFQRLPHHAVQHQYPATGTRKFWRSWTFPPCMLPGGQALSSCIYGETAPEFFGAPIPIARGGGRPAGGAVRSDLLPARRSQKHLRHRLLPADEYRREAGLLRATAWSRRSPGAWTDR